MLSSNKAINGFIGNIGARLDNYLVKRENVLERLGSQAQAVRMNRELYDALSKVKPEEVEKMRLTENGKKQLAAMEKTAAEVSNDSARQLSWEDRVKGAFMNDKGEYSGTRIGGAIAAGYMGANIIGHGSLGIPFISSASWNR